MYRKPRNWTHTQDAALKLELFRTRKEGVESCLVEEADKQTLQEPGMTSFEGNTTAVYILVGGTCRNGERSCAEHKCLNWTGVCKPEGRVYVPHLGVSACTVLHLSYWLDLVHDGSLSHLEISVWLVCCLRYDLC